MARSSWSIICLSGSSTPSKNHWRHSQRRRAWRFGQAARRSTPGPHLQMCSHVGRFSRSRGFIVASSRPRALSQLGPPPFCPHEGYLSGSAASHDARISKSSTHVPVRGAGSPQGTSPLEPSQLCRRLQPAATMVRNDAGRLGRRALPFRNEHMMVHVHRRTRMTWHHP